jgi:hypothetical protein
MFFPSRNSAENFVFSFKSIHWLINFYPFVYILPYLHCCW